MPKSLEETIASPHPKGRCKTCLEKAVWHILWADGRALSKYCDDHKKSGLVEIKKNGKWAAIVWIRKVKGAK